MFKLTISDKEVILTDKELFSILLEKVRSESSTDTNVTDVSHFIETLFQLVSKKTLTQFTLTNISTLMFLSGYYYAKFLEKNNVEIIKEKKKEK